MRSRLIEHFGEERLKTAAPCLYQALCNVRPADSANGLGDSAQSVYLSTDEVYMQDMGIGILQRGGISDKAVFLIAVAELYEAESGRKLETYENHWLNCRICEAKSFSDSEMVQRCAKQNLRLVTTFIWSTDGVSTHEEIHEIRTEQFWLDDSVIVSLDVTAPRAKDHQLTRILYDRTYLVGETTDYFYENVMMEGKAKVMMPFEGSLSVKPLYKIVGINSAVEPPSLALVLSDGSSVQYGWDTSTFISHFAIAPDGLSMRWKFGEDWNAMLHLSRLHAKTIVSFACCFTLDAEVLLRPGYMKHTKVMITSAEEPEGHSYGSVEIEPIEILWGCVAAGTSILMADGEQRPVEQVGAGEAVMTAGGLSKVTSVFRGQEKELVHLKTQNGKELLLTQGHPVRCARGVLPASELNASDIITTVDGVSPIAWLFRTHGDYTVYSLALDPPAMLYCNGVEAGDFDAQNSIRHSPERLTPMEIELHNELRLLLGEPREAQ